MSTKKSFSNVMLPLLINKKIASSSLIRNYLQNGNLKKANKKLISFFSLILCIKSLVIKYKCLMLSARNVITFLKTSLVRLKHIIRKEPVEEKILIQDKLRVTVNEGIKKINKNTRLPISPKNITS